MRFLLFLLCFLPVAVIAQKDEGFAKFVNEDGSLIRGSSVTQFYERQVPVYNLQTNANTNSTVLRFTMARENGANILQQNLLSGKKLLSGEIDNTYINFNGRLVRYKVKMEEVTIEDLVEADGAVTIQLRATRMGWTYYSYTKSGLQSVSSKTGWDAANRTAWTNF